MSTKGEKSYPRFRLIARIEHAWLMIAFTALAVTGLPQMYAQTSIGEGMIDVMGGIETVRILHRWFAVFLIASTVYHLITSTYRGFVRREKMRILPTPKDARDVVDTLRYNFGISSEPPRMGKFNFGEKVEYWAVIWGTAVMVITGFMLWNPIATTAILPGQFIPAALAAHGGEALLAVLSIVVWHMYNVHVKHYNPSMFTGELPYSIMKEEHALELERLEAGGDPWTESPVEIDPRRQRIFLIASTLLGFAAFLLLIWAFTFEQTAITTVPLP